MSSQPKTFLSEAEYLEIERRAERKSEYWNGEMFAMSGASSRHVYIVANVMGGLWQQLKQKPCRLGASDWRLRVSPTRLFTYPDVMVACEPLQFADDQKDTLLNPVVIIEVLSDSTSGYDQGKKFQHYRTLSSLSEYLTVEQDSIHVEHYSRQPENRWLLSEFADRAQTIQLASIGCSLCLAEVYDKIEW